MNVDIVKVSAGVVMAGVIGAGLWRVLTTGTKIVQFLSKLDGSVDNLSDAMKMTLNQLLDHEERITVIETKKP